MFPPERIVCLTEETVETISSWSTGEPRQARTFSTAPKAWKRPWH